MSLPPGFLDELRTRISLSQVVGRKVMWDNRKSNAAKGDMWAPCPFHQEKTASFHVDDRKGFYYCFGCQAKGDAISFVKDTENVSFIEAIEILARESGMPMPERDPRAQEKSDAREKLAQATEAAVQFYKLQLKSSAARDARDYLEKRGIDEATLARFEIGFAPSARRGAFEALQAKGVAAEDIITAGIASKPDDGGAPYDAFRDRIMFPIRDPRGRCIGFGGRAMDPNARAKYLNSRETPLFDKGRALFNHGPSREAAGKGQPLIVAEGYMDVIALWRAGFEAAVAPLGTAITADQLHLMWRVSPEPIIALDGDKAGLRAAMRLIDLALPMLGAQKSLRFCILPEGQDPDDLIRAKGRGAMQTLIDGAQPLVNLLWQRETEGRVFDSPERRAELDKSLRRATAQIQDPDLRHHYDTAFKDLKWQLFRQKRQSSAAPKTARSPRKAGFMRPDLPLEPLAETLASALASGAISEKDLRWSVILALLCLYPALLDHFEPQLDRLHPELEEYRRLSAHLLGTRCRDKESLNQELEAFGLSPLLENLLSMGHVRITPPILSQGAEDKARDCLTEEFAKLAAWHGIDHEMAEALEGLDRTEDDPHLSWRLTQALKTLQQATKPKRNDQADASEDTSAYSNRLRHLIEERVWEKKKR